ncbi:hypothetical protein I545_2391 [Mycobacterium kansasii 662]|uniref:Uncharacterized protein n=3 Tax=Mycobacterium kansasii TaxID=1768 RepID=A0A1V3XN35_MYCKA|nr:hypothetical protein MKAN_05210 [Mycobacterium kansasii ATCC 12478]EUA01677.1 hypothetical protein I547_4277 [Mycobacterium kansasii 824]EUA19916.1 hypothetical protein I545_2391 [Mycobacterium kansasii 662]OOK80562.1 hypothetical protein BZL29_1813 [Mycobacterium kansasii]
MAAPAAFLGQRTLGRHVFGQTRFSLHFRVSLLRDLPVLPP